MSQALEFLKTTDWEYKEATDSQYVVKVCPLCFNDKFKFYINKTTSLWDCKVCQESGNIYQLKAKLGGIDEIKSVKELFPDSKELDSSLIDGYVSNLEKSPEAIEYLKSKRKFLNKTIRHFKLGLNGDWLMIPHFQNQKLWNFKMRNYKDKAFKRITGQPSVLFNSDNINFKKKALVIVESETDCMAAWQMGINNVVGLTAGAGTFMPEWISFALRFEQVYVCLNSDLAGDTGARKIAEKIGIERCYRVILPTKDVNDFLIENGSEQEFSKLLKKSKKFDVKNITSVSRFIENIDEWFEKEGLLSGLEIPFPDINKFLNGLKSEDLIIISGDAGVGKTTITLNILYHLLKNNHRCLSFFLEGKISYYILRMMSMESNLIIDDLRSDKEKWKQLKLNFADYPLFFYSGAQFDLTPDKLTSLLQLAVKMYDIEFVMIDNLQKFVKDDRNVVSEISRTVSILKDLAVDLKIPILLITHIRKLERGSRRVSMHDAKSSSTIYQDADVYLTLWNNKGPKDTEDYYILSINKNRMGEGGIDKSMIFEKEFGIFRERIKEIDDVKDSSKEDEEEIEL